MDDWLPDLTVTHRRHKPGTMVQRWHVGAGTEQDVYFISAHPDDMPDAPVKIGISNCPAARLAEMQQVCPARLVLLALRSGGQAVERQYHQRFAADRLHGEWFRRSDPLMRVIRRHQVRLSNRSTGYHG